MVFLIIMPLFSISSILEETANIQYEFCKKQITLLKDDTTKLFMDGLVFPKSDGSQFRFSEVKEKVVLLDFWATWCGPCRKQHLYVEALHEHIDDPDFEIITVSIDRNLEDWERFFDNNHWKGINIYLGWDDKNPLFKMGREPIKQNNGKPLTKVSVSQYYLIDKSLNIAKIEDIGMEGLQTKIQSLLAQ
jgi:thiol-disulfide isomerase/thioredoxin